MFVDLSIVIWSLICGFRKGWVWYHSILPRTSTTPYFPAKNFTPTTQKSRNLLLVPRHFFPANFFYSYHSTFAQVFLHSIFLLHFLTLILSIFKEATEKINIPMCFHYKNVFQQTQKKKEEIFQLANFCHQLIAEILVFFCAY